MQANRLWTNQWRVCFKTTLVAEFIVHRADHAGTEHLDPDMTTPYLGAQVGPRQYVLEQILAGGTSTGERQVIRWHGTDDLRHKWWVCPTWHHLQYPPVCSTMTGPSFAAW